MSTSNPSLAKYLKHYLQQLTIWIGAGKAKSVVLAIKDRETHEVSERWHFNIQVLSENMDDSGNLIKPVREEKLITAEIASIIRQITATVSFLPELNEDCKPPFSSTILVLALTTSFSYLYYSHLYSR
ncbi:Mitotic spindle checkpoint component mad2, variant 2 [Entomophthora muscae]|uniref:Mitotic spindle checkpoint component mad2, variant 2 n=1 Tax=Entomophthora muscae TaxID=34485 RepID=A0ACC2SRS6_9FUNG|nr:Mitotic spindle checkpoint component mad2, variant 2 [Entomophthora muscae]